MPPEADCTGLGTGLGFGGAVQSATNTGGNTHTNQRCLARSDCFIINNFSLAIQFIGLKCWCICVCN